MVQKIKDIEQLLIVLQPVLKYIVLGCYMFLTLYINRVFVQNEELRKWVLKSLEENGRASGKKLTAFIIIKVIVFATVMAILYSDKHLLPEYFLLSLLTFVASLYGINLVSKYKGFNNNNNNDSQSLNEEKKPKEANDKVKKDETASDVG